MRSRIFRYIIKLVRKCYFFLLDLAEFTSYRVNLTFLPFHHFFENAVELHQRQIAQQFIQIYRRNISFHFIRDRCRLIHDPITVQLPVFQLIGHEFIHLVFQQLFYQFLSRILFFSLFVHFFGKKHPAFDIQKRRCHHKKFAHNIQIFFLHGFDVFHILVRDLNDWNIVDIYFIFFNQM